MTKNTMTALMERKMYGPKKKIIPAPDNDFIAGYVPKLTRKMPLKPRPVARYFFIRKRRLLVKRLDIGSDGKHDYKNYDSEFYPVPVQKHIPKFPYKKAVDLEGQRRTFDIGEEVPVHRTKEIVDRLKKMGLHLYN